MKPQQTGMDSLYEQKPQQKAKAVVKEDPIFTIPDDDKFGNYKQKDQWGYGGLKKP